MGLTYINKMLLLFHSRIKNSKKKTKSCLRSFRIKLVLVFNIFKKNHMLFANNLLTEDAMK